VRRTREPVPTPLPPGDQQRHEIGGHYLPSPAL
jgi:hypothetical protein